MLIRYVERMIAEAIGQSVFPYVYFRLKADSLPRLREIVSMWQCAGAVGLGLRVALFYHADVAHGAPKPFRATIQFWEPCDALQFEWHAPTTSSRYEEYRDMVKDAMASIIRHTRAARDRPTARSCAVVF